MTQKFTKIMVFAFVFSLSLGLYNTANAQDGSGQINPSLKEKIEKNREARNNMMENRRDIRKEKNDEIRSLRASTSMYIKEMKDDYKEGRKEMMGSTTLTRREIHASTTEMFKKFKDDRKELMKKMRRDSFEIRKDALVKQLNLTIDNLLNIRSRVNDRITKLETDGKNVTDAKTALANADDKISKAKTAIDALVNYKYSGAATSTAEIDLEKPRKIGDDAIKAVKEARDSLRKVVEAIAKIEKMSNETASTTPSSN